MAWCEGVSHDVSGVGSYMSTSVAMHTQESIHAPVCVHPCESNAEDKFIITNKTKAWLPVHRYKPSSWNPMARHHALHIQTTCTVEPDNIYC